MLSAGVVLYLFAHSLPRIGEAEAESRGFFEKWVTSEFPERLDGAFNGFAGKSLRRLRVMILKFDNAISESLKRFKTDTTNGKTLDFKDMMGDKEGVEVKNENKDENEHKRKKTK